MEIQTFVGLALIALAVVLAGIFAVQRVSKADRGGVVIGGDNSGVTNTGKVGGNITIQNSPAPETAIAPTRPTRGKRWLAIVATVCGITGLSLLKLWEIVLE